MINWQKNYNTNRADNWEWLPVRGATLAMRVALLVMLLPITWRQQLVQYLLLQGGGCSMRHRLVHHTHTSCTFITLQVCRVWEFIYINMQKDAKTFSKSLLQKSPVKETNILPKRPIIWRRHPNTGIAAHIHTCCAPSSLCRCVGCENLCMILCRRIQRYLCICIHMYVHTHTHVVHVTKTFGLPTRRIQIHSHTLVEESMHTQAHIVHFHHSAGVSGVKIYLEYYAEENTYTLTSY